MATLGKRNLLPILRESAPGIYLDGGELGEILLPGKYRPASYRIGDLIDVFVYRDSEDRLVATTEKAIVSTGGVACLKVVGVNARIGAFLYWGLEKDLLLPFYEQMGPVNVGDKVVVAVFEDPVSGRILASARLAKFLDAAPPPYRTGQPVQVIVAHRTPLGYTVVVENTHLGLLYRDEFTSTLAPGQEVKAFIKKIREDGKIDLTLDASGYQRVLPLKLQIIQVLEKNGGRMEYDDETSPHVIREKFGVSKKAFKQALGALFKSRRIRFLNPGTELVDNSEWQPGEVLKPRVIPVKRRPNG